MSHAIKSIKITNVIRVILIAILFNQHRMRVNQLTAGSVELKMLLFAILIIILKDLD